MLMTLSSARWMTMLIGFGISPSCVEDVGDAPAAAATTVSIERLDAVGLALQRDLEDRRRDTDAGTELLRHRLGIVLGPGIDLADALDQGVDARAGSRRRTSAIAR